MSKEKGKKGADCPKKRCSKQIKTKDGCAKFCQSYPVSGLKRCHRHTKSKVPKDTIQKVKKTIHGGARVKLSSFRGPEPTAREMPSWLSIEEGDDEKNIEEGELQEKDFMLREVLNSSHARLLPRGRILTPEDLYSPTAKLHGTEFTYLFESLQRYIHELELKLEKNEKDDMQLVALVYAWVYTRLPRNVQKTLKPYLKNIIKHTWNEHPWEPVASLLVIHFVEKLGLNDLDELEELEPNEVVKKVKKSCNWKRGHLKLSVDNDVLSSIATAIINDEFEQAADVMLQKIPNFARRTRQWVGLEQNRRANLNSWFSLLILHMMETFSQHPSNLVKKEIMEWGPDLLPELERMTKIPDMFPRLRERLKRGEMYLDIEMDERYEQNQNTIVALLFLWIDPDHEDFRAFIFRNQMRFLYKGYYAHPGNNIQHHAITNILNAYLAHELFKIYAS